MASRKKSTRSIVSAKRQSGFWRSGRFWSFEGVEVDNSEITDAMRNEPMLAISPIIDDGKESEEEPTE